jgi:hypothetical protein
MAVQPAVQERVAKRRTAERVRRPATVSTLIATDDVEVEHAEPAAVVTSRTMPRIVSVYRGVADGALRHSRCEAELHFVGMRGGIELDFYCLTCREHISLPEAALARVPVGRS